MHLLLALNEKEHSVTGDFISLKESTSAKFKYLHDLLMLTKAEKIDSLRLFRKSLIKSVLEKYEMAIQRTIESFKRLFRTNNDLPY